MARGSEPTVTPTKRRMVGWREWVGLPELNLNGVKAKVDTGARSSCLHAYDIREVRRRGRLWLVFKVHPLQRNDKYVVECESPLLEYRQVTSSNGTRELRPAIRTDIELGGFRWPIDLTLTRRDGMGFRMLLGREALRGQFTVDPGRSYLVSRRPGPGRTEP